MSIVRPASDIQTAGWTAAPGPDFYASLDEVSANEADYVSSPVLGATVLKLGLATPFAAGTHSVRFHAATSFGTASARLRLLDDADVPVGLSEFQLINSTPTTYELPVTTSGTASRVALEVGGELPDYVMMQGTDPISFNGDYLSFWAAMPPGTIHLGDDPIRLGDSFVSFES